MRSIVSPRGERISSLAKRRLLWASDCQELGPSPRKKVNPSRSLLVHGSVVCCLLALVGCDLMKKEQSPPPPQQPPPAVTPAPKPAEKAPATTKVADPAPTTTPPPKVAQPAPTTTPPPKIAKPAPVPVTTPPSKVDPAKKAALPPELLQVQGEIGQAKGAIDMTIAKLEVLAATTGDDLDKPSEDAAASIEAMGKSTDVLKTRADEMRQRGAAYFEAWEKQLASTSTPAIAQLIAKRKEDLAQRYSDVLTSMQQARAAYDPFWAELQDTSKAIDDGLNPDKVKLFAPTLAKLKTQAAT